MRCLSEGSPRRGRGGKAAQPEARGKTQREEARQLTFAELLGQRPFNQVVSHISRHPGGRREVRRKGTCQSHPGNPVQTAPQPTTPSGTCRRPEPPRRAMRQEEQQVRGKAPPGTGPRPPSAPRVSGLPGSPQEGGPPPPAPHLSYSRVPTPCSLGGQSPWARVLPATPQGPASLRPGGPEP